MNGCATSNTMTPEEKRQAMREAEEEIQNSHKTFQRTKNKRKCVSQTNPYGQYQTNCEDTN